ncbi:TonB-dependent receptor [Bermanella marisrubri]|uniref:Outer membrane protein n=1 Tax=Bermanella marisrubri TaxID=207949 RepID=Q1N560_9GAMM|nr:TonB-dependent receptor [Bermanella marisrubri]EAT13218.1 Outer membrane protein [Oceanobacter sp. RED65] [Bermanella marisrubri]QIZ83986.1 TonB-dependent receptor [Bermanella marisrubri]
MNLKECFIHAPLALAISAAFSAQVSADQTSPDQENDTSNDQATAYFESVVVTGQKTERSLQDTVDSVKIIDAEQLEDERLTDIYDVFDRSPNVAQVTGTGNSFTIRGIDALGVSGGGNSYLASMYLDGAPLSYRALKQGTSVWDVSQVEILRGPQSTLQGRNSLAGAILIRTEDPTYDTDAKARLIAGSHGRKEVAVAAGGSIIDDELAFRIAAEKREFDGYIENPNRDENANYSEGHNVRAKVLFEPNAIENLKVLFTHHQNDDEVGVPWQSLNSPDRYDDPQVYFNDRTREKVKGQHNILDASYRINNNLTFNAITSHSDVDYHYDWDGDTGADLNAVLIDDRNEETLTQEFRINISYDNLTGVVGAYYSDLAVDDFSKGNRLINLAEYGINADALIALGASQGVTLDENTAAFLTSQYPEYGELYYESGFETDVTTQALFADFTYSLNQNIDILAGVRYDTEEQGNQSSDVVTLETDLPDPAAVGAQVEQSQGAAAGQQAAGAIQLINGYLVNFVDGANGTKPPVDDDFAAWLPKLGVTYHFTDDVSSSFVAQRAYRSGGVGVNLAEGRVFTYDPEYVNNYEFSTRTMWLDGMLSANTNIFYLDWTDQQVEIRGDKGQFDTDTVNAGESNVKGAEIELMYYDGMFSSYFGLGHSRTEFTKFMDDEDNLEGRSFTNAPEWTANIGATYRTLNGFILNANANYQDSSYVRVNPNLGQGTTFDPKNDARTIVNTSIGYEWSKFKITLAVDNLLDEEYVLAASRDPSQRTASEVIGAPRTYSVTLQASMW